MPQREREHDRERDEDHGRDDEAKARTRLLALPFDACSTTRAVLAISLFDRSRIDRGVVRRGNGAAGWLGHGGILSAGLAGAGRVDHTFLRVGRWLRP